MEVEASPLLGERLLAWAGGYPRGWAASPARKDWALAACLLGAVRLSSGTPPPARCRSELRMSAGPLAAKPLGGTLPKLSKLSLGFCWFSGFLVGCV